MQKLTRNRKTFWLVYLKHAGTFIFHRNRMLRALGPGGKCAKLLVVLIFRKFREIPNILTTARTKKGKSIRISEVSAFPKFYPQKNEEINSKSKKPSGWFFQNTRERSFFMGTEYGGPGRPEANVLSFWPKWFLKIPEIPKFSLPLSQRREIHLIWEVSQFFKIWPQRNAKINAKSKKPSGWSCQNTREMSIFHGERMLGTQR